MKQNPSIRRDPLRGRFRTLTLSVFLTLLLASVAPIAATTLTVGFTESIVVEAAFPANFSQFSFAGDGTLILADKFGLVTVFVPDPGAAPALAYTVLGSTQLAVDATGERGINGLAADPDFATNRRVWLFYSTPEPTSNRLSRFVVDAEGGLISETVMLSTPALEGSTRNGGCLRFAADKTLFVSTGDDAQGSLTAQDSFDLRGKILRLNRDGSAAAGNPFLDGVAGDPRVWAFGFRNPYRISVQPESGNLFIADVGESAWEELSLGIPGADFGWADIEGPEPEGVPGEVYPVQSFSHPSGQGAAIIGGDLAPEDFAPGLGGDYFFADFAQQTLSRITLDVTNTPQDIELFAEDFGPATDLQFGPKGALYYVCRSCTPASLRKIEYVGAPNLPPVARASALPSSGVAPLEVTLDGLESSDADEDALSYDWDLGDGSSSTDAVPVHVYDEGVYEAVLTVSDGQGSPDATTTVRIVAGNEPPVVSIVTPPDESHYSAGDLILHSGQVNDPEEGMVPCTATSFQVFLHHGTHSHPVRGPVQGNCVGAFSIPTDGIADADQWYEIRMTGHDQGVPLGVEAELSAAMSIAIRPNLAALNFETTPIDGLAVRLDGEPLQTPQTVMSLVSADRVLSADEPFQGSDGLWYRFQNWSDGGDREHSVTTSPGGATYTAAFACAAAEVQNVMINPGVGDEIDVTWDESTTGCQQAGAGRYRIYSGTIAVPDGSVTDFPDDPLYRLVGTSETPAFSYVPSPRDVYFIIVGAGPDGADGIVGHYGK